MIEIKRGFTDAKKAGDAAYFKSKPCMLCAGNMYWVRGHRCCVCNPKPEGKIRTEHEAAKQDNYYKDGPSISGKYIAPQLQSWPAMQFEDAETADHIGKYSTVYPDALRYASSAADVAEG